MPRIAILGGTFDPPHIGHLVLGECVAQQFDCERVLFIPAGNPYRKTGADTRENRTAAVRPRKVTIAGLRLEMVRLAVDSNPTFSADGREVRRGGPTYTVDTLRELRSEGQEDLVLVFGSDAVADLPNWREPEEIQRLARIVVAEKSAGADTADFERVTMPQLGISSTLIRERVRRGQSIRYLVPESVRKFIELQRLYRDT